VNISLTKSNRTSRCLLSLIALVLFLALPGISAADDDDPPGRVARLNLIQGSVSFQPAGTQDWVEANPNRPLTTGDQLWADQDSRGELHVGSAAIRISDHTGLSFLNLTDNVVQIQVAQGTADFRIVHMYDNETYEIDTGNLAFTILRPGEYRVDVNQDGTQSIVTVRNGAGEVTAGGQAYKLDGGQQYIFSGTDQVNYDAESLPDPDGFDSWCRDRDHREDSSQSARYISRDVIGYDDLDSYGTWRTDPTYGPVWVPSGVAVGWAPYHTGHWAYVAPWGWTWVDDAPWGFAPFHYGRWAYVGSSWAWVPGPVAVVGVGGPSVGWGVRPVYAPALVGFVGGGGFSAAIAIGGGVGVAWVPLGPRDVWVPGYHCSPAYMNNVNVTSSRVVNRTQITNVYNTTVINRTTVVNNVTVNKVVYSNQSAPGAVSAVSQKSFQSGQPVAASALKVAPEQISNPKVVAAKAVEPTPQAVTGAARPAPVSARPPAAVAAHPVVTKMTPSPKAIPVGHTQPLTTAQYKPASQPGARPNTNFKAGSQPANAGKPASPANPVANNPDNNAEAAKPADSGNPAASKPANHAEAGKPANPPANENHAAQPPNKVTPPPPHNANPGANNSNPNTKPNPEAARNPNAAAPPPPNKLTPPPPHNANPGANNSNPNTKPNPEAARNPNVAAPPPPNKLTPPPSHNANNGMNNNGNTNTTANPEADRKPNVAAPPPKPATPPPAHTNAHPNEEPNRPPTEARPPGPPPQKPATAARPEPKPEPRNEPHNEPKPEAKKPPKEEPKDKHPDKH
jgi:hypothetical protein